MRKNFDRLKQNGHDKWKQVDLDAAVDKPWKKEPCLINKISSQELKQDLKNLFK